MRSLTSLTILIFWCIPLAGCGYNTLQDKEEKVFTSWANVESSLQRRAELIPQLVDVVKGNTQHEQETLQKVIEARTQTTSLRLDAVELSNPAALGQLQAAQEKLTSALGSMFLLVERYPELKANQSFLDLQNQLEGTENRINVARQRYNEAVGDFNAAIRKFPENITNKYLLKLARKEYFVSTGKTKAPPKLKFD